MNKLDKRILATLFFSVFATVTGVGIVVPLLPAYATSLGASGIYIGLVFGVFALSRTIFMPIFGRLSDRKGRKALILPGLAAYTVISLVYLFASNVASLVAIRFVHGIASAMLMPVITAYVGDIIPLGREGQIMGAQSTVVLLGFSLGPLFGGTITDRFGIETAFIAMSILAAIGFVMSATFLPPSSEERIHEIKTRPIRWRTLLSDPAMGSLLSFRFAYVVCIGIIWGFLPLYANMKLELSNSAVGALITTGILTSGVLNMPMGYLADRFNKHAMVMTGGVIVCFAILSFSWADSYRGMLLSSGLFGIGGGIAMPALMALATIKGSETESMGTIISAMTVAHSLGMLTGAMLGGIMMDMFRLHLVFPAGSATMATGIIVFFVVSLRSRHMLPRNNELNTPLGVGENQ